MHRKSVQPLIWRHPAPVIKLNNQVPSDVTSDSCTDFWEGAAIRWQNFWLTTIFRRPWHFVDQTFRWPDISLTDNSLTDNSLTWHIVDLTFRRPVICPLTFRWPNEMSGSANCRVNEMSGSTKCQSTKCQSANCHRSAICRGQHYTAPSKEEDHFQTIPPQFGVRLTSNWNFVKPEP